MKKIVGCMLLLLLAFSPIAIAETYQLVAWAPGYPGTREQAQPSMDEFATVVAELAAWEPGELSAVYYPELDAGRLAAADAALVFAPFSVFREFGAALDLQPLLRVYPAGSEAETWTLVAHAGVVDSPQDLAGFKLQGLAGFSPRFVRGLLADWGALPDSVEIEFSGRVLSSLRKAAAGEPVAVLLDAAQAEALERLPFAAELEVVTVSAPTIGSLVCTVGKRFPDERAEQLATALVKLGDSSAGGALLESIRVVRFAALSESDRREIGRPWSDVPN